MTGRLNTVSQHARHQEPEIDNIFIYLLRHVKEFSEKDLPVHKKIVLQVFEKKKMVSHKKVITSYTRGPWPCKGTAGGLPIFVIINNFH